MLLGHLGFVLVRHQLRHDDLPTLLIIRLSFVLIYFDVFVSRWSKIVITIWLVLIFLDMFQILPLFGYDKLLLNHLDLLVQCLEEYE